MPGTNMTFAGIPRGKERADVITYLNGKSDKPAELPKQAAAPPPRSRPPAARQVAPAAPRPSRTERCTGLDIWRRSSACRAAAPPRIDAGEAAAPMANHRKTDIIG